MRSGNNEFGFGIVHSVSLSLVAFLLSPASSGKVVAAHETVFCSNRDLPVAVGART
jgi:drug/metabolite transporter superfamily protein YnfA